MREVCNAPWCKILSLPCMHALPCLPRFLDKCDGSRHPCRVDVCRLAAGAQLLWAAHREIPPALHSLDEELALFLRGRGIRPGLRVPRGQHKGATGCRIPLCMPMHAKCVEEASFSQVAATIKAHDKNVRALDYDAKQECLVTGSFDRKIQVYKQLEEQPA